VFFASKMEASELQQQFGQGNTNTSQDQLKAVFQMLEPNDEGLISLRKLQDLFQQHQDKVRTN
jgi:Ca2+-binding EF-hand superfamily protein